MYTQSRATADECWLLMGSGEHLEKATCRFQDSEQRHVNGHPADFFGDAAQTTNRSAEAIVDPRPPVCGGCGFIVMCLWPHPGGMPAISRWSSLSAVAFGEGGSDTTGHQPDCTRPRQWSQPGADSRRGGQDGTVSTIQILPPNNRAAEGMVVRAGIPPGCGCVTDDGPVVSARLNHRLMALNPSGSGRPHPGGMLMGFGGALSLVGLSHRGA